LGRRLEDGCGAPGYRGLRRAVAGHVSVSPNGPPNLGDPRGVHRLLRWCANVLMLAALWAWTLSAWKIVVHQEFWWQMVWGPGLCLILGTGLKSVEARTLAVQLGIDPGIDVYRVLAVGQIRELWMQRPARSGR
jgi:hypothetical protein